MAQPFTNRDADGDDGAMRIAVLAGLLVLLAGCGGSGSRGGGRVQTPSTTAPTTISVTSADFSDGAAIPRDFTCFGAGRSPHLSWKGMPAQAKSIAIVVSDPDAPSGTFIHWVLYDLPAEDGALQSGQVPAGAKQAKNSAGSVGWTPPCPPTGTHRYIFTVYALSQPVKASSTQDVIAEISRHATAAGTLLGKVAHQ